MNGRSPRVSVVIACFNQGAFLGEAIRSAQGQTQPPSEIIVVDDGSTDDTAAVAAASPGVRCLRQRNEGVAAARNAGLAASTGDYLVFLDADDRLLPNAIEKSVACLEAHPNCAFVYGHVSLIDREGAPLRTPVQPAVVGDPYLALLRHNFLWTPGAVMYRRRTFDTVTPFDRGVDGGADFELNARIAREFPICCSDTVVLEYRRHDDSMSENAGVMLKSAVTVRRRHRRLIGRDTVQLNALRAGLWESQDYYGRRLALGAFRALKARRWRKTATDLMTLFRYHPRGFMRQTAAAFRESLE